MNAVPFLTGAAPTHVAEPETQPPRPACGSLSSSAQRRLRELPGEPLFLADWREVAMLHFEVAPEALQRLTPFEIDRFEGRAFITLVSFRMADLRLRQLPACTRALFRPFTDSRFLNLRTYVKTGGEAGIQFLAEWLSNRASVPLGPLAYGLPYRAGHLQRTEHNGRIHLRATPWTRVRDGGRFEATLEAGAERTSCRPGSLDEFLMERYTAFTVRGRRTRRFHIWHPPWSQARCRIERLETTLLERTLPTLGPARFCMAHCCVDVRDVWMSRPFTA